MRGIVKVVEKATGFFNNLLELQPLRYHFHRAALVVTQPHHAVLDGTLYGQLAPGQAAQGGGLLVGDRPERQVAQAGQNTTNQPISIQAGLYRIGLYLHPTRTGRGRESVGAGNGATRPGTQRP